MNINEEPVEAFVAMHVADGENMYTQADEGDDEHHHQRKLIDLIAPLDLQLRQMTGGLAERRLRRAAGQELE